METEQKISPIFLSILGNFLRTLLVALSAYYHNRENSTVELAHLGRVEVATLDVWFRIFWFLQGRNATESVVISVEGDTTVLFRLKVVGGKVCEFVEIQEITGGYPKLVIELNGLQKIALQGAKSLFLALLRSEGIRLAGEKLFWSKIAEKVRISSDTVVFLNQWFFPISGLGIILWFENQALPWIFYGGTSVQLHLSQCVSPTVSWIDFTQQFRHGHNLSLTISLRETCLRRCFAGKMSLWEFLLGYGQEWCLSIPIEINDFILQFDRIWNVLPLKETCAKCNIDQRHVLGLGQSYLENAWKYLKLNPVYINLKDGEHSVMLELTHEAIYEVVNPPQIPEENLFILDIGTLVNLAAWLNDNLLRMMIRCVDEILPAEIAEKIDRNEILIYLTLQNKQNKYDLFICGGEHDLPGDWGGDYSLVLLTRKGHRILLDDALRNIPLTIAQNGKKCEVYFPVESLLSGKSLQFQHTNCAKNAQGICSLVSETSLLTEIVPGLRRAVQLANWTMPSTISIASQNYTITGGTLLYERTRGRIWKNLGQMQYLKHTWLISNSAGIASVGISNSQSTWWQEIISATSQSILVLDEQKAHEYLPPQCFFPNYRQAQVLPSPVLVPNEVRDRGCRSGAQGQMVIDAAKGIGWRDTHEVSMCFWVLRAWAVPFDKRGNYLLRIRALARLGREIGFALLEFPCRISGMMETGQIISTTCKKVKDMLVFYSGDMEILRIEGSKYLRPMKSGWFLK